MGSLSLCHRIRNAHCQLAGPHRRAEGREIQPPRPSSKAIRLMNHFPNLALVVPVACAVFIAFGLAVALAWRLSRRPPYKTFMSLRTKSKIRFLKAMITDRRI